MNRLFPLLLAVCGLQQASAIETRCLCVGDNAPIALRDIVSVSFDASSMYILQTDGQTLDYPLQPIAFDVITGLQQLPADVQPDVPVCDVWGRPYVAGAEGLWVGHHGVSYGAPSLAATVPTAAAPTRAAALMGLTFHREGFDPHLQLEEVESISFSQEYWISFNLRDGNGYQFGLGTATGISFGSFQTCVTVHYDGETVDGVNPYFREGLTISAQKAHVTVRFDNATSEVEYELSGSSENGSFKIYSGYKWQATLQNLTLQNPHGSAINSQTGKKGTIKSPKGTVNTLSDGAQYAASSEDQKGCVFGEGQLIFNGKGTLRVTSLSKHAICSDDYVSIDNGTVEVLSAASDAIHAKDSVIIQGGTVTLAPLSDGIDSDGPVTIRKGENGAPMLTISTTGDGAKGIKTGGDFLMTDGQVSITQTGKPEVKDGDKSRVVGIRAAGNIRVSGGTLVIDNRAEDGKALSAEGEIDLTGGNVQY